MGAHLTQPSRKFFSSHGDLPFLGESLSAVGGINAPVFSEPQDPQDAGGRRMPAVLGEFGFDSQATMNRNNPSLFHLNDFGIQNLHKSKIGNMAVAALWFNLEGMVNPLKGPPPPSQ